MVIGVCFSLINLFGKTTFWISKIAFIYYVKTIGRYTVFRSKRLWKSRYLEKRVCFYIFPRNISNTIHKPAWMTATNSRIASFYFAAHICISLSVHTTVFIQRYICWHHINNFTSVFFIPHNNITATSKNRALVFFLNSVLCPPLRSSI